jgi:ribosomal protein L32
MSYSEPIYIDDELSHRLKTIQRCSYCGEETNKGNKYCKQCSTQKGREELDKLNEEIKVENKLKGYN